MAEEKKQSYVAGLAGIMVGESKICTVGKKGMGLMYRGYSIQDLATNCQFEEVIYLLTRNKLPNKVELENYLLKLNKYYEIPNNLIKILELTPKDCHPMDVMKIICCFLGSKYPEKPNYSNTNRKNIFNINETLDICDRLLASFPSAMCYWYRFHFFNDKIDTKTLENKTNESIAEHIVRLLHSNNNKLKGYDLMIDAINTSLICYAEHGLAASTFSARITASTLSDSYSSICAAICTLKGPLHGGANEMALELIKSFNGNINAAKHGMNEMLNEKKLIMGFGHRIYKKGDPRSPIMKNKAKILSEKSEFAMKEWMNVSDVIEQIMFEKKKIFPNMDFPASMLFFQCGIPNKLYTPIFVCSRTTGWFAHIIEQREDNKLIRPSSIYKGPQLRKFIHINDR